jgi:Cu/Ag efflux protein CusF
MKVFTRVIVAALMIPAGVVFAQTGGMKSADTKAATAKKTPLIVYAAAATVKKVDAASGTVTLAHSPVKELNWPAMTMLFTIRDKALFGKLAVDRKVEFTFIQDGPDYVVTAVK